MAFLAKASSPSEWKTVASTVAALVEDATFDATTEGLEFRAMDPSHVALIDLKWPNSAFEKYTCDKQFRFSVRVEDFVKLIRRAEAKDSVEITAADDETLILRLSNGYKREFKLHLIESTASPTPLPKLSFDSKIRVVKPALDGVLADISAVADHITIEATKDKVTFSGKSDTGSASASLEKGSKDLPEIEVAKESKATYSIDYLQNMTKASGSTSDTILAEYSSKMPLRLEFKLGQTGGVIRFYLAPRVEER